MRTWIELDDRQQVWLKRFTGENDIREALSVYLVKTMASQELQVGIIFESIKDELLDELKKVVHYA
jgi:hypothetical protein